MGHRGTENGSLPVLQCAFHRCWYANSFPGPGCRAHRRTHARAPHEKKSYFTGKGYMMLLLILALGLLLVGTVLLVIGADWFLDGAGDLARALGVSALVLGVLLAGLEPEEMLTAAIASARGAPALAVGNVIGTNVTIVTVALGLSVLITPMVIDRSVRRQALIATGVSILPIAFLFLRGVSRLEGALLLAVFVGYTIVLFRVDRDAIKRMAALEADDDDDRE